MALDGAVFLAKAIPKDDRQQRLILQTQLENKSFILEMRMGGATQSPLQRKETERRVSERKGRSGSLDSISCFIPH